MKTKILSLLSCFAATYALEAEQIKFIGTASKYGDASTSDITNPAKWGDGASALSGECDYIIDDGKFCGFGIAGSFPGKSLTLGVVGGATGNLASVINTNNSDFEFDFGTLILNKGVIETKIKSSTASINAYITVNAKTESPYGIHFNGSYNSRINLTGSIKGDGALRVYTGKQDKEYMLARIKSNMEKFSGIVEVGSPTAAATVSYRSPVLFGDSTINGEIKVNPCGVVGPCGSADGIGEFSVKKLTFNGGGMIRVGVNSTTGGTIRVTESLDLPSDGKVTIDVTALPGNSLAGRRHPVLVVPAGSGMSKENFELKAVSKAGGELYGKLLDCSLQVETVNGFDTLYLDLGKYTVHTSDADGWNESSWKMEYSEKWSGVSKNTPMSADVTYVSYKYEMVTPNAGDGYRVVFPGRRLVLSGRDLLFAARNVTIDDFHVMNAAELRFWSLSSVDLYGKITLSNPESGGTSLEILQSQGYSAKIHSDISGSGGIKIIGALKNDTNPPASGSVVLSGMNTAFTGRISLINQRGSSGTNITLRVSDVRALGGPMSTFAYNSYSFHNWSRLQADADLSITEPTRGVYFEGNTYVNVPNAAHTFTLASQTTMAGKLVKEGAGTLALGGTVKFTSSQKDVPETGTNVLHVADGRIMPVSKGGADGLEISFAEGTGLRLSPFGESDADVKEYGLYNVKWNTPFNLAETDGKLNVALDMPSNRSEIPGKFSFGVCTVSEAAAESVRGKIALPAVRGYNLSVSETCIDEGTVTFRAAYCRRGLSVVVK